MKTFSRHTVNGVTYMVRDITAEEEIANCNNNIKNSVIAEQKKESYGNIKNNIFDLFAPATLELGHISLTTGQNVNNDQAVRSVGMYPLNGHTGKIRVHGTSNVHAGMHWFFYTSSGQFISQSSVAYRYHTAFDTVVTIPLTAVYYRFIFVAENYASITNFDLVEDITAYMEAAQIYEDYTAEFEIGSISAAGHEFYDSTRVRTTDFFPAGKGTVIEHNNANFRVFTYDKNLNLTNAGDFSWRKTIEADCFIRLVVSKDDRSESIQESEIASVVSSLRIHRTMPKDLDYSMQQIDTDDLAYGNLVEGKVWEYDYINDSGNNVGSFYTIRTRNFIPIPFGAKYILIDATDYAHCIGGIAFYDSSKTYIRRNLFDESAAAIKSVPDNAKYYRMFCGQDWDTTVMTDTQFGKNIKVTVYDDSYIHNYDDIYAPVVDSKLKAYDKLANASRIGYIWISDVHLNPATPETNMVNMRQFEAVANLANRADIDFVCVGGDLLDAANTFDLETESMVEWLEPLTKCRKPIIFLTGNHDDNWYGSWHDKLITKGLYINRSEFYNSIHFGGATKSYYYFDIEKKGTRVCCLDTIDYGEAAEKPSNPWWSLSEDQVKWFCGEVLNTDNRIIIMTHMCPNKDYNFYQLGDEGGYHTDLISAIAAYNNRGTITLYGETYSFENRTGHIDHIHCGHTHFEPVDEVDVAGIPCVFTSCALRRGQEKKDYETVVDEAESKYIILESVPYETHHMNSVGYVYYKYTDRQIDTIKESLFDLVSADSGVIHTFRIGAGTDRTFGS